jgi:hypothetical protein
VSLDRLAGAFCSHDFQRINAASQRIRPASESRRTVIEDSAKTGMHFVNLELDLSLTFAERALASFSAGRLDKAKRSASAAHEAYRSARKFFHKLSVTAGQRKQMQAKLAKLEVVIGKLSVVK